MGEVVIDCSKCNQAWEYVKYLVIYDTKFYFTCIKLSKD